MSRIGPDTPVIFSDGTKFFMELSKKYIKHEKGLFILAPSGSGKTYFCEKQEEPHWIDGDYLWVATKADPTKEEWEYDSGLVQEVNDRCDVVTHQANKLGFWVLGSSNNNLRPDAIVLPSWEQHKKYINRREMGDYDGGAKAEDYDSVLQHRKVIAKWEDKGVPRFDSIAKAAEALSS